MPPRLRVCGQCLRASLQTRITPSGCRFLSIETFQSSSFEPLPTLPPAVKYPATQPPSHRPPELRRSQLHRQYTSLLRSTPLMLLFQHNNLKATEWMAIRRELAIGLRKVEQATLPEDGENLELAEAIKIQIINASVFGAALRVVEYYDPEAIVEPKRIKPSTQAKQPFKALPHKPPHPSTDPSLRHSLSRAAHDAVINKKHSHPLTPLLSGPLAILTFPAVSTAHLKAALSILAPHAPNFRAPTRRTNPGYYDPNVQLGLQKLLLLGARVEGKVFDLDGTRWVGGIEGGLDGLRGQLVAMLQGAGAGVTNTLDGMGKSLYFTMESRRSTMEEEEKGSEAKEEGKSAES